MYITIVYTAKILSSVCMDDGNLPWVDPFLRKALQQAISFCTEEGVTIQL